MAINNQEQRRLLFAMRQSSDKGKDYGNMVKKVPAYIQKNGFPYTMAFLHGEDNGRAVFETIYAWHTNKEQNPLCLGAGTADANAFLEKILNPETDGDWQRAITLETLSLMKSLRRFAKSDADNE